MASPNAPIPRRKKSRTVVYAVATFVFLSLALILTPIFLRQTSVGSRRFVGGTLLLWTATVLVILALLTLGTVLGRNLIKLHFERKSGQAGSRFRTKMVRTFIALSLLPAVLLFFLAYGLINKSIEQWFSAPAAQLLEHSRGIAAQYYGDLERRSLRSARALAAAVGGEESLRPELRRSLELRLSAFATRHGLDAIRVYDARGRVACEVGRVSAGPPHGVRAARIVSETLRDGPRFSVERAEEDDALRDSVWATAPLRDGDGRVIGAALAETRVASLKFKAASVEEAYDRYTRLQRERRSLRSVYLLILALSTLLIVFAFSWFAIYLAKRITVPIQALVEGAAAVAGGNLSYRVETEAFDELDDLVVSFNRMTGELAENKSHIEAAQDRLRHTNVELDDRRRYIETILQTIATGVVSLDVSYRVGTMNRAAARMFGLEEDASGNGRAWRLDDLMPDSSVAAVRALLHKSQVLGSVARNIELDVAGRSLHLATTATPLLDSQGQCTGWVLVLDDVTELLAAEKTAAWQEVARRLAHEIKNPLTPIQLSAERVLRRYKQLEELARREAPPAPWRTELAGFDGLLEECVRTITQEADALKKLVDEFSRFARLPAVRLQDADLHGVLDNTLSLYNGRVQDVRVLRTFSPDVPRLRLDLEQMRRVFVNLFDNALEAMAENRHPKVLEIRTLRNTLKRSVRVEVIDTGRGFPKEYTDSLFLPYFSTRKGGTGLGLAIVKQIIADHNGQVRAEPNRPLGTRIVIDLPLAQF